MVSGISRLRSYGVSSCVRRPQTRLVSRISAEPDKPPAEVRSLRSPEAAASCEQVHQSKAPEDKANRSPSSRPGQKPAYDSAEPASRAAAHGADSVSLPPKLESQRNGRPVQDPPGKAKPHDLLPRAGLGRALKRSRRKNLRPRLKFSKRSISFGRKRRRSGWRAPTAIAAGLSWGSSRPGFKTTQLYEDRARNAGKGLLIYLLVYFYLFF